MNAPQVRNDLTTLFIGAVVIVALILIFEEIEAKRAAETASVDAAASAQASIEAAYGQSVEATNIAPAGQLPSNDLTEAPNTSVNSQVAAGNALIDNTNLGSLSIAQVLANANTADFGATE